MAQTIGASVSDEFAKTVKAVAKEIDRPVAWLIKEALEEYLSDMHLGAEAVKRLQDPNEEFISSEEMRKRLGL